MLNNSIFDQLIKSFQQKVDQGNWTWLSSTVEQLTTQKNTQKFFITYSQIGLKFQNSTCEFNTLDMSLVQSENEKTVLTYFLKSKISQKNFARVILLNALLKEGAEFYLENVKKIIEIADTSELNAFLKYLCLLPNPENFQSVAVDCLRTNVQSTFESVAYYNPYPYFFFTVKEWNQMFLKAAFMNCDLKKIPFVDQRANEDLSIMISDYAHERWAAGRTIDPDFWQPITGFMSDRILEDMKKLLVSDRIEDQEAARKYLNIALNQTTNSNLKSKIQSILN